MQITLVMPVSCLNHVSMGRAGYGVVAVRTAALAKAVAANAETIPRRQTQGMADARQGGPVDTRYTSSFSCFMPTLSEGITCLTCPLSCYGINQSIMHTLTRVFQSVVSACSFSGRAHGFTGLSLAPNHAQVTD